jgi:hypothetical protein
VLLLFLFYACSYACDSTEEGKEDKKDAGRVKYKRGRGEEEDA